MEDRELLELAAKALGLRLWKHGDAWRDLKMGTGLLLESGRYVWNPLADDGDALRLAVALEIELSFINGDTHADGQSEGGADKARNTRRAITRAAAEIGRSREK